MLFENKYDLVVCSRKEGVQYQNLFSPLSDLPGTDNVCSGRRALRQFDVCGFGGDKYGDVGTGEWIRQNAFLSVIDVGSKHYVHRTLV